MRAEAGKSVELASVPAIFGSYRDGYRLINKKHPPSKWKASLVESFLGWPQVIQRHKLRRYLSFRTGSKEERRPDPGPGPIRDWIASSSYASA